MEETQILDNQYFYVTFCLNKNSIVTYLREKAVSFMYYSCNTLKSNTLKIAYAAKHAFLATDNCVLSIHIVYCIAVLISSSEIARLLTTSI